jgi:CspA family cold shock protein
MRRAAPRATASDTSEFPMQTGTVKWFIATKGYGSIQPQDGAADVFVHTSEVEQVGPGTLGEGQKIDFEMEQGRQGKSSAIQLRRA